MAPRSTIRPRNTPFCLVIRRSGVLCFVQSRVRVGSLRLSETTQGITQPHSIVSRQAGSVSDLILGREEERERGNNGLPRCSNDDDDDSPFLIFSCMSTSLSSSLPSRLPTSKTPILRMFVEMFRASVDMMTSDIGEQYAPPARLPTGNRMLLLQNHKFVGRKYF